MKLEQSDSALIFSKTELPDVFFTEYLYQASSDSIKVYLYMLFLSKYNKDIKVNDMSKALALPYNSIQESIKYWESQGVLTKKANGYIVNNIQEIELHKLYSPKVTQTKEELEKSAQNQTRSKAIEHINNHCFNGVMSPSWYNDISLWFKKYSFDDQVMIALFEYCFNRSALHRNYIQTVADAWAKSNIKNYNDLESYYEKQESMSKIKKSISKKLGLNRGLTQYEEAYIEKWIVDYKYDLNIIEIALKKTTSKSNPNFEYLNKLISDWFDRNLKSPSDVQAYLLDEKNKSKNIKELAKKTGYNNYEQRNYDNLDSLYANN